MGVFSIKLSIWKVEIEIQLLLLIHKRIEPPLEMVALPLDKLIKIKLLKEKNKWLIF